MFAVLVLIAGCALQFEIKTPYLQTRTELQWRSGEFQVQNTHACGEAMLRADTCVSSSALCCNRSTGTPPDTCTRHSGYFGLRQETQTRLSSSKCLQTVDHSL